MSGTEVAIVVHYQATAGKGDEVAALLSERTLRFCQVVEPDGSLWMRSTRSPS
jgi:hypothetical protein